MTDDRLALEISYLRSAADGIRIWPQGMDTDGVGAAFGRAVDALEAVLNEHTQHVTSNFPAPGICSYDRLPWPCSTVRAITRALTGEGGNG